LDRAEKIPNLLRRQEPLLFSVRVQAFRDPLGGELPHVQIFMNDVALSPGHNDNQFSFMVNNSDRKQFESQQKITNISQKIGTFDVFDPFSGISGPTSRRVSACP
jgi:hypothetical protein